VEPLPVTQEVAGSSPVAPANYQFFRIVARSLMCRDVLTWSVVIISHFFIAVAELQRAPRLSHSGYRPSIRS
jgi:hypothetical protein